MAQSPDGVRHNSEHRLKRRQRKIAFLVGEQRELRTRRGDIHGRRQRDHLSQATIMEHDMLAAHTLIDHPRLVDRIKGNIRLLRRGGRLPQDTYPE